jgi:hypothetical protein
MTILLGAGNKPAPAQTPIRNVAPAESQENPFNWSESSEGTTKALLRKERLILLATVGLRLIGLAQRGNDGEKVTPG